MTEYGKSIHPAAAYENRQARRMKITKQNSLTFTFKKSREAFVVTQWNGDLSPPLEYMKEWLLQKIQALSSCLSYPTLLSIALNGHGWASR